MVARGRLEPGAGSVGRAQWIACRRPREDTRPCSRRQAKTLRTREAGAYLERVIRPRSLFAWVLLAVVLMGGVLAPVVHWAGHGHDAHPSDASEAHIADISEVGHTGECPGCAHLQKTVGSEPATAPFYVGVVGVERAVSPPEVPAVQSDVAAPEGRGPPTA